MKSLLKFRKNNKGNTLIIVIVGMFLLIMLGATILSTTVMNYSMKSIDRNQKRTFYTAEEAIDEIYAGIGRDVMSSMEYSYSYILNNMLTKDAEGNFEVTDNAELNKAFRSIYYYYLTKQEAESADRPAEWNDIKRDLENNTTVDNKFKYKVNTDDERKELETYLKGMTTGGDGAISRPSVSLPVYEAIDRTIEYEHKTVENTTGENIEMYYFTIEGVEATCVSSDGVTSSISTDVIVEMPIVNINFSAVTTLDYGELFKYSIIAEGDTSKTDPVLKVDFNDDDKKVNIKGNIYAGNLAAEDKVGIDIKPNTYLSVEGTNIVTSGEIKLDSQSYFSVLGKNEGRGNAKLWAKNIKTSGLSNNIDITDVDCVVKDDLEINAQDSSVTISGNYFGIGYRENTAGTGEADSSENDAMYFDTLNNKIYGADGTLLMDMDGYIYEHEKSSSIIVNGSDASIDLSGLKNLLLGGRAYVDLLNPDAAIGEANSTYMTGESVSIRGNQEAYLVPATDEYFNNKVVNTNPVTYNFFEDKVLGKGVMKNNVVAKKVGSNVYFYKVSNNPVEQTRYFEDIYYAMGANKAKVREKVSQMGLKSLLINRATNIYSVGSILTYDPSLETSQRVSVIKHNVENNNNAKFLNYINDIDLRYQAMLKELKDYGNITTSTVPSNVVSSIKTSTKTPWQIYINDTKVEDLLDDGKVDEFNFDGAGYDGGTYHTTYATVDAALTGDTTGIGPFADIVITDEETYTIPYDMNTGVVIASGNVKVMASFTGIIICKGDISIDSAISEVNLMASPDLVQWLASEDKALKTCLKGFQSSSNSGTGDATAKVDISQIKYQDLVAYKNWQKQAVNADIDASRS